VMVIHNGWSLYWWCNYSICNHRASSTASLLFFFLNNIRLIICWLLICNSNNFTNSIIRFLRSIFPLRELLRGHLLKVLCRERTGLWNCLHFGNVSLFVQGIVSWVVSFFDWARNHLTYDFLKFLLHSRSSLNKLIRRHIKGICLLNTIFCYLWKLHGGGWDLLAVLNWLLTPGTSCLTILRFNLLQETKSASTMVLN
jgi:hypothetical protein